MWIRSRLILLALSSAFILAACKDERSVAQHIISNLELMEAAAEEGRHLDFMGYVGDDFSGQSDSMKRRDFHRFMLYQMNQKRRLHATLFPIRVKETGEAAASAVFQMLVTGSTGLLPDSGQMFSVTTEWSLDGGDWLLSEANWETVQMPQL